MAPKFYHALNCNRRIASQGRVFDFRPYAMVAGTWCGTYATQEPKEQAALDALAGDPRQAISAITQAEYEAKASRPSQDAALSYNPLLTRPDVTPQAEPLVEGSKAVVIEQPNPEPAKPVISGEPLAKAADALQVGQVQASK